jgi:hypothetical protein
MVWVGKIQTVKCCSYSSQVSGMLQRTQLTCALLLLLLLLMRRYVRKAASAPKPVYLVDFAMAHPPDTWQMPAERFVPINSLNTVSCCDVTLRDGACCH